LCLPGGAMVSSKALKVMASAAARSAAVRRCTRRAPGAGPAGSARAAASSGASRRAGGVRRQGRRPEPDHHADAVAGADAAVRPLGEVAGPPSPSRSTVVRTWQPATTRPAGRCSPESVRTPVAGARGGDRGGAVAEADAAAVRLEPALQRDAEHAAAALGVARRPEVHDGVPADEVGGGDLVGRRPGLRAHPGQRRLEPLVVEVLVEQAVGRGEELPGQLEPVRAGRLPDAPQGAAEVAHRRRALEGLEDRTLRADQSRTNAR
jgi:hypothetical protein